MLTPDQGQQLLVLTPADAQTRERLDLLRVLGIEEFATGATTTPRSARMRHVTPPDASRGAPVPPVPALTGGLVRLRVPRDRDADDRISNGRHAEIVLMYGGDPARALQPVSLDEARSWLRNLRTHPCAWVVEFQGRCIGEIRLDHLDEHSRSASLAVGLQHPAYLGRGLGTDAIVAALDFAFDQLALHRVGLRVLAFNERAVRAYRKVGFVLEGREREAALVNGEWHDDLVMAILESDPRLRGQARGSGG